MKKELISLPGYRLNEYMLVLQPHEELERKVMSLKREFAIKFDAPSAEWGRANIPLLKFSQLQLMEERVLNRLKTIAIALPACKVELKNFGHYPSHTIYVEVETKMALQMIVKHLKTAQALLRTKEHKPHFMDNFHITIAGKLLPWQHEKAWTEYSQKHFTGRFIAKNMFLLKRPEGSKNYQIINRFDFLNMPVVTTQGVLF